MNIAADMTCSTRSAPQVGEDLHFERPLPAWLSVAMMTGNRHNILWLVMTLSVEWTCRAYENNVAYHRQQLHADQE
jgi:hypothetical protein